VRLLNRLINSGFWRKSILDSWVFRLAIFWRAKIKQWVKRLALDWSRQTQHRRLGESHRFG
jgi:hypothetical protein